MGKFVIKKTKTGFKFDLKASNGQVIGSSQVYASKTTCTRGIESVQKNAVLAKLEDQTEDGGDTVSNPKFEVYIDKAGECRFRLTARNGNNILASEGYKTKTSCMNGIESVRKNAPEAPIEEE